MGRPIAPCKDCKDRYVGCHGECERYLWYLKLNEEYKAIKSVEVERDSLPSTRLKAIDRANKRRRRD